MEEKESVRIDKWLWAVRVFKTRSLATNACKSGKILIKGNTAKASHVVKIGEIIEYKFPPIVRTFKVTGLLHKRVSAKIAVDYVEELTPESEFEKLKAMRNDPLAFRPRGAGRPTKRERRDIDVLKDKW